MKLTDRSIPIAFSCLISVIILAGCGSKESDSTVQMTGMVTFGGKPLPAGMIVFEPNPAKGNRGPQGHADIKDGKFDTQANGKPSVVGAVIVRVTGGDGVNPEPFSPFGKLLFEEYTTKIEIARDSPTLTLDVPSPGAKR